MPEFGALRDEMVERQLKRRGIDDVAILDAFRQVPRELFVPPVFAPQAYGDHPIPIEAGQTVSQPYIVALMIQAAGVKNGDRVLEVGSGSGYAAAVLSRIAGTVVGIERHAELAEASRGRLGRLGYDNVEVVVGDGTVGWPARAPYNAILASASGSHVPAPLIDQLAPGGCIVMPIGPPQSIQRLRKIVRNAEGELETFDLGDVRFVPLIGAEAWGRG